MADTREMYQEAVRVLGPLATLPESSPLRPYIEDLMCTNRSATFDAEDQRGRMDPLKVVYNVATYDAYKKLIDLFHEATEALERPAPDTAQLH